MSNYIIYGKGNLKFTDVAGWVSFFKKEDPDYAEWYLSDTAHSRNNMSDLYEIAAHFLTVYTGCETSKVSNTGEFTAYITETYDIDAWSYTAPFLEGILSLGGEDGQCWRDVFEDGKHTSYDAFIAWPNEAKIDGEKTVTVLDYLEQIDPYSR